MVPPFDGTGNLLPGVHPAIWAELVSAFGGTPHRDRLLRGLRRAAESLRDAGCSTLYVDGSFVTRKQVPSDFDAAWEPAGVDAHKLDPVLLIFDNQRIAQKVKYGGELFPSSAHAEAQPPWRTFLDFFQHDKHTGQPKGIVAIDLRSLP